MDYQLQHLESEEWMEVCVYALLRYERDPSIGTVSVAKLISARNWNKMILTFNPLSVSFQT